MVFAVAAAFPAANADLTRKELGVARSCVRLQNNSRSRENKRAAAGSLTVVTQTMHATEESR
jgi:hypothetical protein